MKKLFLSLVAALLAVPTFAQFGSGSTTLSKDNLYFGVRLGMTIASVGGEKGFLSDKVTPIKNDLGGKAGLTLAGIVGLRLSDSTPVFLESGLYYTQRGGKDGNLEVTYNNLEVPVLIKYGFEATPDIAILPFIGPYFSYAVSGNTKQKEYATFYSKEKTGTFDEDHAVTGGFKRPNMGIKVGCGAEWNMLYLEVGYQFGLTNICKNDDFSAHSRALFANFGVNF